MTEIIDSFVAERAPSILREPLETINLEMLTATHACFLEQLCSKPIDQAWLDKANELILVGSEHLTNSPQNRDTTLQARKQFWGEHMGWDDPSSPYHNAYMTFKKSKPNLIPLKTNIESFLMLHEYGIDLPRMLQINNGILWKNTASISKNVKGCEKYTDKPAELINLNPGLISISPPRLTEVESLISHEGLDAATIIKQFPFIASSTDSKVREYLADIKEESKRYSKEECQDLINFCENELGINNTQLSKQISGFKKINIAGFRALKESLLLEGVDANKLIAENMQLLQLSPDQAARRIRAVKQICGVLGWNGDPVELINYNQRMLGSSDIKLAVHAKFFARFATTDITIPHIIKLINQPLESHFITVSSGLDYNASNVKRTNTEYSKRVRNALVTGILLDRNTATASFGSGILRSYERYITEGRVR